MGGRERAPRTGLSSVFFSSSGVSIGTFILDKASTRV